MLISLLLLSLATLVVFMFVRDWLLFRRLPALCAEQPLHRAPFVSIIIPARNEAANIARCLDGALAQQYAAYEVVVVDDASTDATPHILAEFAARHPDRLRIVTGRPLPAGWVGKCNACLSGAQHARGEWLLFLDADTAPHPTLLRALLAFGQRGCFDVVSAFPFNELNTWSEKLVLPAFFQFAFTAFPLEKNLMLDAPASTVIANGQCLLVRTETYWGVGGHEVVKDKVLEDIELAQALRRAGHRVGIATAFDQLRVRMYRNLGEIVQGLSKHAAAGLRASGWRAFWAVLRMTLTSLSGVWLWVALVSVCASPHLPLAWLAWLMSGLACVASLGFWAMRYRRWYSLPGWMALFAPLGWLMYLFIATRGTIQVLFKRGVTWKERVYS